MKDHIVDLVVAVDECTSILWLRFWISKELHHVVEVWDFPYGFAGLLGYGLGLSGLYGIESPQLTVVEARGLSKLLHVHASWYHAVEFG